MHRSVSAAGNNMSSLFCVVFIPVRVFLYKYGKLLHEKFLVDIQMTIILRSCENRSIESEDFVGFHAFQGSLV